MNRTSVVMNRKFDQRLNRNQIFNMDRIQMPETHLPFYQLPRLIFGFQGFARVWQHHGGDPEGGVGRLGPHPHLRGTLRRRQHLLLAEAGLHLLSQSVPWTPAGLRKVRQFIIVLTFLLASDFLTFPIYLFPGLSQPHGDRHHKIHFPLPARPLCIFLW